MELKPHAILILFAALALGLIVSGSRGDASATGIRLFRGRLTTVTSRGGMLHTQQGDFWVSSPVLCQRGLAGDSLLVLGSCRGRFIQPLGIRLKQSDTAIAAVRMACRRQLENAVPDPAARGLAGGLVIGLRSMIPGDVARIFLESGTSHLLALSGLHTGIVAALLTVLMRRLLGKRALSAIIAAFGVAVFVVLSGGRASTIRAGIMAVFVILHLQTRGGRVHLLSVWWVALVVSVICVPGILADRGAWLSYAAVLSLLALGRKWNGRAGFALSSLHAGVAVTLGTAPLVNAIYGGIRPTGPIATVLSIPPMIVVMASGAAALAGFVPAVSLLSFTAGLWLGMLGYLSSEVFQAGGLPGFSAWALLVLVMRAGARWNGFERRFR